MKKILLINWDNYPNTATGGIYSWARALIEGLPHNEFIVLNWLSNPNTNGTFVVPPNVTKVIDVPLFGALRIEEFRDGNDNMIKNIRNTSTSTIDSEFLPMFGKLTQSLFASSYNHNKVQESVVNIHNFMRNHDLKKCVESPKCWDLFASILSDDVFYKFVTIRESQMIYNVLQRIIQVISIQLPKVDIIHSSLAWFPALCAIPAKLESKCPMIVTEHGVAFSLLSLYTSSYLFGEHSSILWKFFCGNIIKSIYGSANRVYPVCKANVGWESSLGLESSKIKIIYNGVDTNIFQPREIKRETRRPTVVYVGRIEIFKDIMTLLYAIKYATEKLPDINCLIYGACDDEEYAKTLVDSVCTLEIKDNVKFMGKTSKPADAYNAADAVVLTSLAEGFPFSIIEAMACGKPIVSTKVGGVPEALEGCGLLVKSRHPKEFSEALVSVLTDDKLKSTLSKNALDRARVIFSRVGMVKEYDQEYEKLLQRQSVVDYAPQNNEKRFGLYQMVQKN
ncbi:MAG: GT4 family glycosyltransferase PelF [Nitrososphaerota archaeon]